MFSATIGGDTHIMIWWYILAFGLAYPLVGLTSKAPTSYPYTEHILVAHIFQAPTRLLTLGMVWREGRVNNRTRSFSKTCLVVTNKYKYHMFGMQRYMERRKVVKR